MTTTWLPRGGETSFGHLEEVALGVFPSPAPKLSDEAFEEEFSVWISTMLATPSHGMRRPSTEMSTVSVGSNECDGDEKEFLSLPDIMSYCGVGLFELFSFLF